MATTLLFLSQYSRKGFSKPARGQQSFASSIPSEHEVDRHYNNRVMSTECSMHPYIFPAITAHLLSDRIYN
ncbi:hypothetical protein BDA96_03G416200 [Sorghum bicolor]|uniref:Uncharacterized protein n=2 Tax=Sorghum bicolor TaxID=4558 RepID=A0A921URF2_SORBI|nr:hypothetical protein BDA96_03G416200 [Sorghum bicolor]KXG33880.1 hypothetical protein SORBI_3003G385700 [Sorghum bicolor]